MVFARLFRSGPTSLASAALAAIVALAPIAAAQAQTASPPANAAPTDASGPLSPDQKTAIEKIIHDYIVKHPEVLQEAMVELEKRQQQAQQSAQKNALATEKTTLFDDTRAAVVGNPKGDVTLVEFFDYNCPYCKRALVELTELIKVDPNLKVILRDFPVLGPESLEASKIGLAVKQQLKPEAYFDYHTKLMATKGRIGKERALALAKEMGVDMARLAADEKAATVQEAIDESVKLGDKLSLTGTPSFVVGEEVVSGAVGLEPLRQMVASVRKCGRATC